MVVDTVLSSPDSARGLGDQLHAAGYVVRVWDVEATYEVSAQRVERRWRESYEQALAGVDDDGLGGRWVPSEYGREVFDGPGGLSRPEHAAGELARSCPAVLSHRVYRVAEQAARPVLASEHVRAEVGAELQQVPVPGSAAGGESSPAAGGEPGRYSGMRRARGRGSADPQTGSGPRGRQPPGSSSGQSWER